jgi:hypothetical protein
MQAQRTVDFTTLVLRRHHGRELGPPALAERVRGPDAEQVADKTARTRLRIRVRCLTNRARCATRRRRDRTWQSGTQTSEMKPDAPSSASTRASTLSVFTLADALALVFIGFDTVTRPARRASTSTIAQLTDVDSITT